MYKVHAAAVLSLVTHCGWDGWVGLQVSMSLISTHHGQLFILWLHVGPEIIGSQDSNRIITEFVLY